MSRANSTIMKEQELDLYSIWKIIKGKLFAIIVVTMLVTIVSGIVTSYLIEPKYKSTVAVFINDLRSSDTEGSSNQTINDINMYQKLVDTYSEIARSRTVAEDVIAELGLALSVEAIQGMISSSAKGNTQFLNISITSSDSELSYAIANQIALSLKKVSMKLRGTDIVQILDPAQFPDSPSSPNLKLNLVIGFIIGLLLSLFGVFVLEFLNQTIKDSSFIQNDLELPFLGSIPRVEGEEIY